MINLDHALYEADLKAVLWEGGQVARALVLAMEGLRKGEFEPDDEDLDLLLDLARDTRLLWGRASELRGGDSAAEDRDVDPAAGPRTSPPATVIPLRSKPTSGNGHHNNAPDGSSP